MNLRLRRPRPQLILLTVTLISAVNALVALGLVQIASMHLAVINVALASVLGVVARGLVPVEPPTAAQAECRAHQPEGGSN